VGHCLPAGSGRADVLDRDVPIQAAAMILGSLFQFPLHPITWKRPTNSPDYRVVNPFIGQDLINGGIHRAIDTGNFRRGDPVLAPVKCLARSVQHQDGAKGVIFDLGADWTLEAWHLDSVRLETKYLPVVKGALVGVTGASGRVTGAHTHIELKHRGVKIDPEPYLSLIHI